MARNLGSPEMIVFGKRRRGRPRLSNAPSAAVHLKLPADDYDRASSLAKQQRESVQDLLRRGLKRLLKDDRGGRF